MLYEKTLQFYDELPLYSSTIGQAAEAGQRPPFPAKQAQVRRAPGGIKSWSRRNWRGHFAAARDDLERRVLTSS